MLSNIMAIVRCFVVAWRAVAWRKAAAQQGEFVRQGKMAWHRAVAPRRSELFKDQEVEVGKVHTWDGYHSGLSNSGMVGQAMA